MSVSMKKAEIDVTGSVIGASFDGSYMTLWFGEVQLQMPLAHYLAIRDEAEKAITLHERFEFSEKAREES